MKLFVAAKALIFHQGKLLAVRETADYADGTNAGKFDVVGGRINPGEKVLDALKREIVEETGLNVSITEEPITYREWFPVVRGEKWHIVGMYFEAKSETAEVTLSNDHDEAAWIDLDKREEYSFIDNIIPVLEVYEKRSS